MNEAILALEDGTVVRGIGLGKDGVSLGELVFTTTYTGYVESLTDPSYRGQNLMFTYPLIGNYGVDPDDFQSDTIQAEAVVVSEGCENPSHRESEKNLEDFLVDHGKRGIAGVNTRALTRKIRTEGTVKSALFVNEGSPEEAIKEARQQPHITEKDLVSEVTSEDVTHVPGSGSRIGVIVTGAKYNIIENLRSRDFEFYVLPSEVEAAEIESYEPKALMVPNGPGDPKNATGPIETVQHFASKIPIFGICFGTQIISLAFGASTFKLKFGHRGANQPDSDPEANLVHITSQNHGFAVEKESLEGTGLEVTQTNANDGTVEAIQHKELEIYAVQYHPEACPGPKDTEQEFFDYIKGVLEG